MSKSNQQIKQMLAGARWISTLSDSMLRAADNPEDQAAGMQDLHHLASPNGAYAMTRMFRMMTGIRHLSFGTPVEITSDDISQAFQAYDLDEIIVDPGNKRLGMRVQELWLQRPALSRHEVVSVRTDCPLMHGHLLHRLGLEPARFDVFMAYALKYLGELYREDGPELAMNLGETEDHRTDDLNIHLVIDDEADNHNLKLVIEEQFDNHLASSYTWLYTVS